MKKLVLTSLLASSALVIFGQTVNAAEVGKDETDLGIRFETDGPVKPTPGPFKDNLALVFTPSKFDFGKQTATANIATYSNKVDGDQYVVVNDDRQTPGATSAWQVNAKLSKLTSKDNSSTELPAKLTFTLDDPKAYDIGTDIDEDTNDYIPNPIETSLKALEEGHKIVTGKSVVLEAGNTTGTSILAKTEADEVKGGFATKLKDTKLVVTSGEGASGKSFEAKVNWSLDNTYK